MSIEQTELNNSNLSDISTNCKTQSVEKDESIDVGHSTETTLASEESTDGQQTLVSVMDVAVADVQQTQEESDDKEDSQHETQLVSESTQSSAETVSTEETCLTKHAPTEDASEPTQQENDAPAQPQSIVTPNTKQSEMDGTQEDDRKANTMDEISVIDQMLNQEPNPTSDADSQSNQPEQSDDEQQQTESRGINKTQATESLNDVSDGTDGPIEHVHVQHEHTALKEDATQEVPEAKRENMNNAPQSDGLHQATNTDISTTNPMDDAQKQETILTADEPNDDNKTQVQTSIDLQQVHT
eukprot:41206_1